MIGNIFWKMRIEMKIKLIYKDETDKYFVRYYNGKSKIVKLYDAHCLAEENRVSIGESEFTESQNMKLDWSDGTPAPMTRKEYQKDYRQKNKEKIIAYQKERYLRLKELKKKQDIK